MQIKLERDETLLITHGEHDDLKVLVEANANEITVHGNCVRSMEKHPSVPKQSTAPFINPVPLSDEAKAALTAALYKHEDNRAPIQLMPTHDFKAIADELFDTLSDVSGWLSADSDYHADEMLEARDRVNQLLERVECAVKDK